MIRFQPLFILFPYTTLFRSNSDKNWKYDLLAKNGNFTWDILQAHQDKFWKPNFCFSSNPTFTWDIAEKYRSEEHTSELQSRRELVCRLLLEKKNLYHRHTIT